MYLVRPLVVFPVYQRVYDGSLLQVLLSLSVAAGSHQHPSVAVVGLRDLRGVGGAIVELKLELQFLLLVFQGLGEVIVDYEAALGLEGQQLHARQVEVSVQLIVQLVALVHIGERLVLVVLLKGQLPHSGDQGCIGFCQLIKCSDRI